MNANTNHHHHYHYNAGPKVNFPQNSRDQKRLNTTPSFTGDTSSSNLNISTKGRNPVISMSSITHGGQKNPKKLSKKPQNDRVKEDPAIPFPQSQKHFSSKLSPGEIEFVASR